MVRNSIFRPPTTNRVSIVIPTYNRADFLGEAIESALSQEYGDIEIIVVDDGSTDETASVVRSYDKLVKYVYQGNSGLSAARNTGVHCSSGEFLVFLDSDDLLLPKKLEIQATFLREHADVAVVYGNGYVMDEHGRLGPLEPYVVPFPPLDRSSFGALLLEQNLFAVHAAMVRRGALPDDWPFDESLCAFEDWDLWLRLVLQGATFAYLDEKVAVYRRHPGNMDSHELEVFKEPARRIVLKVVGGDLDRHLPMSIRQNYRLDRLDIIALYAPLRVVLRTLRAVLWPEGRLSVNALARLLGAVGRSATPRRAWNIPGPAVLALIAMPYSLRQVLIRTKRR
jgi:glycosyltransferase involved in cell wall biosynthesis